MDNFLLAVEEGIADNEMYSLELSELSNEELISRYYSFAVTYGYKYFDMQNC